jgi:tetratricopeptide (TPR) repeat protein
LVRERRGPSASRAPGQPMVVSLAVSRPWHFGYHPLVLTDPSNPSARDLTAAGQQAENLYRAGRHGEAIDLALRVLAQSDTQENAATVLAEHAVRNGHPNDALRVLSPFGAVGLRQPEGLYWLGIASGMSDQPADAVAALKRALKKAPKWPDALYNLALAHSQLGQNRDAESAYRKTLKLAPDHPAALDGLGTLLAQGKQVNDAIKFFERSVKIAPKFLDAHYNLATALINSRRIPEALTVSTKALELSNNEPRFRFLVALCHENSEAFQQAIDEYRAVLEMQPDNLPAAINLVRSLHMVQQLDEALRRSQALLERYGDHSGVLINHAQVLLSLARQAPDAQRSRSYFFEALDVAERAVAAGPNIPEVVITLALVHVYLGHGAEGLAILEKLVETNPHHWEAWELRSDVAARAGKYSAMVDKRHQWWLGQKFNNTLKAFDYPAWKGTVPLKKRLLIVGDQGIGDQILFSSLLNALPALDPAPVLTCDRRLAGLFRRGLGDAIEVVASEDLIENAALCGSLRHKTTLSALRWALGPWPNSLPSSTGNLKADPERIKDCAAWLATLDGHDEKALKVGISWRSARMDDPTVAYQKTIPVSDWRDVLQTPKATFINLQYSPTEQEFAEFQKSSGVTVHVNDTIDTFSDLDGLAALIAPLDLVITCSNVTAHLAGALGIPCWVILPYVTLWYWGAATPSVPTYESLTLFRQECIKEWQQPMAQVAAALKDKLAECLP